MISLEPIKKCNTCKIYKPFSQFHKDTHSADGYRYNCKECNNASAARWKSNNSERVKYLQATKKERKKLGQVRIVYPKLSEEERQIIRKIKKYKQRKKQDRYHYLLRKHGLTREQYDSKLLLQNNLCEICHGSLEGNRNCHVDHCHLTGQIRGLLCNNCNTTLGRVRDNTSILENMIEYIKKYEVFSTVEPNT